MHAHVERCITIIMLNPAWIVHPQGVVGKSCSLLHVHIEGYAQAEMGPHARAPGRGGGGAPGTRRPLPRSMRHPLVPHSLNFSSAAKFFRRFSSTRRRDLTTRIWAVNTYYPMGYVMMLLRVLWGEVCWPDPAEDGE